MAPASPTDERVSTGIAGLDEILQGGLPSGRSYLLRGGPGSGKTTTGLHFLTDGADDGNTSLLITFGEPAEQIRANATSVGIDASGIEILDLSPEADFFAEGGSYDIFDPAEVERDPVRESITEAVDELEPDRVLIDSITHYRYLAPDDFQFRKQVLSLVRYLLRAGATVLFTSEATRDRGDEDLQFLADGVVHLEQNESGRFVRVSKLRGSGFQGGRHGMRFAEDGLRVFPRLLPNGDSASVDREAISSGVPEIDQLLGGGLERGTVTLISGPSGVGKTTLAFQFMKEAAGRGERSAAYIFDEDRDVLMRRSEGVNLPLSQMEESGNLQVIREEPLTRGAGEFSRAVREQVEERDTRVVLLDSLSGYRLAVRNDDPVTHLHALCNALRGMGVTVLITNEIQSITGDFQVSELGISYLADNIVFLRYLENRGKLRKAIGVLKKRFSDFENTLREFEITSHGLRVGDPLSELRGILQGTTQRVNEREPDGGDGR